MSSSKCSACATGEHYECTDRKPERAQFHDLAVAIFGAEVTVCCCDDWAYAVPKGFDGVAS